MSDFPYKTKSSPILLNNGDILISVLVFAAVAVTVLTGLVNWGATLLAGIRATTAKEQAFQIAEAGIDYYRWHLAQYPTDYEDGTATSGPYYHNFYDKNGNLIGGYSLAITPPPLGSTEVTIISTGTTTSNKSVRRVVQAILAEPSLAQYAVVSNDYMRFGTGTVVNGPITSNKGIHFDGIANNVISSAMATYTDPDYQSGVSNDNGGSCTNLSYGVHTCVSPADPSPPSAAANNTVVFAAGRQYPIPATDFAGLTVNLQQLETTANSDGYNFPQSQYTYTTGSGRNQRTVTTNGLGYHMVLSPPNASYPNGYFTLYVVTALVSVSSSCSSNSTASGEPQWDTRSIQSEVPYTLGSQSSGVYPLPSNGVIFFQDDLWVDGQINGARLTIAAGILPDPGINYDPSINVGGVNNEDNGSLLYTKFNGNDTIGLIAQGNINVPLESPDNVTVDAALMAENGRVGRYYYSSYCNITDPSYPSSSSNAYYYDRSTLNLDGMIATNQRYGFAYTDGTGYTNRNLNYDANLLYSPPPNFPLASTQYQMASWKQIQ
jgi:hypothetical protein